MVNKVLNHGADMVVEDRLSSTYYEENKSPFHNLGNEALKKKYKCFVFFGNSEYHDWLQSIQLFVVKTFPVLSEVSEIETEMTIHVNMYMQVENVIVSYRDRPEAVLTIKIEYLLADGFKVLNMIFEDVSLVQTFIFFWSLAAFLTLLYYFFVPVLKGLSLYRTCNDFQPS